MKFKLPHRISEANIQAELYKQAKEAGLNIYLEYKFERSIFDAVIYDGDHIQYIIEVKSYITLKKPKHDTKQIQKYEVFNIPVLLVTRMESVKDIISEILRGRADGSSADS